jgi:hypothetical protein
MPSDEQLLIAAQVLALKPAISEAIRTSRNCHFKVGQTLNLIREQFLKMRGQEQGYLATIIPAIDVCTDGPYTVDCQDALRLSCLIYAAIYPGSLPFDT